MLALPVPVGGMSHRIVFTSVVRAGGQPSSPAQVAQMLQGMNPQQRAQMAAAMGLSPQQLAQVRVVLCHASRIPVPYPRLVAPSLDLNHLSRQVKKSFWRKQ